MGNRLQELRQSRGLSQSQLARAAGVPVGSLRGWEQARRTMLVDAFIKLADALECTLDELAGRTPPTPKKGKGK
jgi:transcriptional regulator with XRE-family HTH domain